MRFPGDSELIDMETGMKNEEKRESAYKPGSVQQRRTPRLERPFI
jgi:hypothetical protein